MFVLLYIVPSLYVRVYRMHLKKYAAEKGSLTVCEGVSNTAASI